MVSALAMYKCYALTQGEINVNWMEYGTEIFNGFFFLWLIAMVEFGLKVNFIYFREGTPKAITIWGFGVKRAMDYPNGMK